MKQLESRGCTIPQSAEFSAPHNVITGEFARKAQKDWAVLCSTQGKSTILVFWGGPAKCFAELASAKDRDFVVKEFGAIEGGKQTLERLSEYLPVMKKS
ncbi:MAG: hypothetical protein LAO07_04495 [Acidobacteriia bacterium]|nr:hypothetical protein [Terriglobia bacterium]